MSIPTNRSNLKESLHESLTRVAFLRKAHENMAKRLARRVARGRFYELALILLTAACAAGGIFVPAHSRELTLASTILAGLAFLGGLASRRTRRELRAARHDGCARRLWLLREKHRTLLTDIEDGDISGAEARKRRDDLIESLYSFMETAPEADTLARRAARKALQLSAEPAFTEGPATEGPLLAAGLRRESARPEEQSGPAIL